MAVTLEWVRDNYDNNKNRLIDDAEASLASYDWSHGTITDEQMSMISWAWNTNELLPAYTTPPVITCANGGCALLKQYDTSGDGIISMGELSAAATHRSSGVITDEELAFIEAAWKLQSINALCPGCYGAPTPPPNMETRTVALTEGPHTIQISLSGYDTLNATINVSPTGVTCTVGPCNTQGPPGVTISGWTVTTYLKTGAVVTTYASWVSSKGGASGLRNNLSAIGEIIDGYLSSSGNIGYLGFSVSLADVGTTIDYYLG